MMTSIKVNIVKFEFYGQQFEAYYAGGGLFLIPIKDLTDALGLNSAGQLQRCKRNPVLSNHLHTLRLPTDYKETTRDREVTCLDLKMLPYYMGGMELDRVKPELYEQLLRFHEEYADVAWAAFRSQMTTDPEMLQEVDMFETPDKREYYKLMDDAAAMKSLLSDVENTMGDLHAMSEQVQSMYNGQAVIQTMAEEIVRRLRVIDARLSLSTPISSMEALTVRQMVASLGWMLAYQDRREGRRSARYWIGNLYSRLYARFHITSFLNLNASDLDAALHFLRASWKTDIGDEPPPDFGAWHSSPRSPPTLRIMRFGLAPLRSWWSLG